MNAPADFDTSIARDACRQLQQTFRDCGFPVHALSMTVAAAETDAMMFVAWRFHGPIINGKRYKVFHAPTFRDLFVLASKWLSENVQLGTNAAGRS